MTLTFLVTFALLLSRISGAILVMPVFGTLGIPRLARALAALFLTALVAPLVPAPEEVLTLPLMAGGLVTEFITGFAMGSALSLVFGALALASELMANQMGLGAAQWFDPLVQSTQSPLGRMAHWLAALVFLGSNMHLAFVDIVVRSFQAVPPGAAIAPGRIAMAWPGLVSLTLEAGLRLAAPVILLIFMVQVFLAVLARLAQSMNAFLSIGLILTLSAGYYIIWVSLPNVLLAHHDLLAWVLPRLDRIAALAHGGG